MNITRIVCRRDGTILQVAPAIALVGAPDFDAETSQQSARAGADAIDATPGSSFFELLLPDERSEFRGTWETRVAACETFECEVCIGRDPDTARWHLLEMSFESPSSVRKGNVVATMIPFDAFVRRHHRVAKRARAVLETAVDAIITIDERGIIQGANDAALRMFGYSVDELSGRNVGMLMPEPYRSEHDDYVRRYLETGEAKIIGIGRKVVARRRDGSDFPVHLAVSNFSIDNERHFTGIIRDLSDLEQVQQQLLQSERLAAIGQMVTGLAHESRNALQRAQAHLDMLSLDLQEMPEQLDLAQRTKTALQDLHRLYEEVRGYAAPIQIEYRECDLNSVWQKEWHNLKAASGNFKIELHEEIDCADTVCEIDVHRMEQVFRNILENAIYACGGHGRIDVCCDHAEINGQPAVRINFEDSGSGMSDDVAHRLFEPFFTTKQKGTGLGMAIVHRIMQAHGGHIAAVRGAQSGACIQVVLPRKATQRNAFR